MSAPKPAPSFQDPAVVGHVPALAAEVEAALSTLYTGKDYAAKARSLLFNIAKNEDLRLAVIRRNLSAEELVGRNFYASVLARRAIAQLSLERVRAHVLPHLWVECARQVKADPRDLAPDQLKKKRAAYKEAYFALRQVRRAASAPNGSLGQPRDCVLIRHIWRMHEDPIESGLKSILHRVCTPGMLSHLFS